MSIQRKEGSTPKYFVFDKGEAVLDELQSGSYLSLLFFLLKR